MDEEIRTFIADWMRQNADLIEAIIRHQAESPQTRYGAAVRAQLDALETERRPDA
jgi:hypothetical protein